MAIIESSAKESGILEQVIKHVKEKYRYEMSGKTRLTIKNDNETLREGVKLETWIGGKYYAIATFIDRIYEETDEDIFKFVINMAEDLIHARLPKSH